MLLAKGARWSLRLPRTSIRRLPNNSTRLAGTRIEQRRWLQQQPPPRRGWAQRPDQKEIQEESSRHGPPRNDNAVPDEASKQQDQPGPNTQLAQTLASPDSADLVAPVSIPDDPHAILPKDHPAMVLLGNSSLVIQRQFEMMNIMIGFEQANRYVIMDGQGQTLGYMAEQDNGIGKAIKRQAFKTHRSFTTHIFDAREREVLRVHRPFAWISSKIRIYDAVPPGGYEQVETGTAMQQTGVDGIVQQSPKAQVSPLRLEEMRVIGEAQQQWAPLRRKYNLFTFRPFQTEIQNNPSLEAVSAPSPTATEQTIPEEALEHGMVQFAHVNEPFLSWDFSLRDEKDGLMGSVNRNFGGFAREIFTDTGVYALRMDSAAQTGSLENADGTQVQQYEREAKGMGLDARAVMLATAVSIDFDYFSRHSGHGSGGFFPLWMMGGSSAEAGGAGAAGAGAAGAAGEVGAAEGAAGAVGAVGRGAAGMGAAESGIAGAGTMAGYEAMQRGAYGGGGADDASPQAPPPPNEPFEGGGGVEGSENRPGSDDVWGEDQDPWGGGGGPGDGPPSTGGGEGGGGWLDSLSDFFGD